MTHDQANQTKPILEIQSESLPLLCRVTRRDGESKLYEIKPASKGKLGASLQGVDSAIERYLPRT